MALLVRCGKKDSIPTPILLPLMENSEIKYVSYVTDSLRQIQHQMEYGSRFYLRTDSVENKQVHYYLEKNKRNFYTVDEHGTVVTAIELDLASYGLAGGFPYQQPIPFAYPRTVFKKERGFGTTWTVQADTQFVLADAQGQPHRLEFCHHSEARLQGLEQVTVPASPGKPLKVLDVRWPRFVNYLYDHTTGDTLWVQRGEGHEYFEPRFGLARSMSNYTIRKKGEAPVYRLSTMDLYLMIIPSK